MQLVVGFGDRKKCYFSPARELFEQRILAYVSEELRKLVMG